MRIRSTKPEFWRSSTIGELDWDTRLVLKALESYVDDNGVGRDQLVIFCADAFPHDLAKSSEVCAKVSAALSRLAEAGLIVRYTVNGEPLIYVRRWKQWQYIDKPKAGRYHRPDGSANYSDEVDEEIGAGQYVFDPIVPAKIRAHSRKVREDCAKSSGSYPLNQSGEQGNRGAGEQNPPSPRKPKPAPPEPQPARNDGTGKTLAKYRDLNELSRSEAARAITDAFNASLPAPVESGLLAGIATQVRKCLAADNTPPQIAEGLKAWNESDSWSPTQIPHFVNKANNRGAHTARTVTKHAAKAQAADDAVSQVLAEMGADE